MTETFTASNGWFIDDGGELRGTFGDKVLYASDVDEAQQFFQELRDHELGRWRDPENPECVVYPKDRDFVVVVDESTGASVGLTRDDIDNFVVSTLCVRVAKRYFEANPQHKPLPTTPGMYGYRSAFGTRGCSCVLELTASGEWVMANLTVDERVTAQEWHDAGELVRLVPEGGDDE